MKVFKKVINRNNEQYDVLHVNTETFDDIPKDLISKAHAVCFYNNKLLLVHHIEWDVWGIPGGTREPNESIEQTFIREILEETKCEVLNYRPISYQKIIGQNNDIHYRLQYICNVRPISRFKKDPAGSVNKILWINPSDFKKYIEKKEFRQIIFKRAIEVYRKNKRWEGR